MLQRLHRLALALPIAGKYRGSLGLLTAWLAAVITSL